MITSEELNELELQCEKVVHMQGAFGDAIKAVAEKHDMDATGLRQHINAKVRDKLADLEKRQETLAQLALFEHNGGGE